MKYRKLHPGNQEHAIPYQKIMTSKELLPKIPLLFGISHDSGECLWAALALLGHSRDKFAGISMMKLHTQYPNNF